MSHLYLSGRAAPAFAKKIARQGRNDRRISFRPQAIEKATMRFEEELIELLPRLRRFARGLTQSAPDADDLCQAAIERALKSRDQWQDGTRLDSWMYRITRNLWIDERRAAGRRGVHAPIDEAATQVAGDGAAEVEAGALRDDVDGAMARLPDEQREVVMLVLVEGYAYREAAEILDVPVGTVTSRLARGRDTLMQLLGEAA
jgi:RNA polymerase sigma-70 factor (ECF subfamily)